MQETDIQEFSILFRPGVEVLRGARGLVMTPTNLINKAKSCNRIAS